MDRFIVFLIVISFVPVAWARAQEVKPLTWIECVIIAQKIHPQILSAQEKFNQAMADKVISKSGLFPQITGSGSSLTSKAEDAKSSKTHSLSLSARQLIFDGAKTGSGIKAALENIKSAQYSLDVVSSDVRLNLRTAFVELMRAQEFITLTEEINKLRRQNVELVSLRYEAGREHLGSLLTTKASLAQAEFEADQARRRLELAQVRLNKELGEGRYKPMQVLGELILSEKLKPRPDMVKLTQDNPFLKQLISKKEAARWGIESAKSEYFPQVYADGSLGRSEDKFLPEKDRWGAGLSFSWPLFEGGSRKAGQDKATAIFKQSEQDLRSGKDTVILTLEESWINMEDLQENVQVQKKFLDAAAERAKISQAQYSNGLITFDDWTIIEDNLVSAKKSYLNAQASVLIAEANWVQAKGGKIDYEE